MYLGTNAFTHQVYRAKYYTYRGTLSHHLRVRTAHRHNQTRRMSLDHAYRPLAVRDHAQLAQDVQPLLLRSPKPGQLKELRVPGGKTVTYLPIEACLENAAEVFGADCSTDVPIQPAPSPVYQCILECKIRISLSNGTVREGMGYSAFNGSSRPSYQALTCISNGKKAALKTFGPYFGLECQMVDNGNDPDATANKEMLLLATKMYGIDWSLRIDDPPRRSTVLPDTLMCKVTLTHRCGTYKEGLGYVQLLQTVTSIQDTMNAMKMCVNKAVVAALADFGLTVPARHQYNLKARDRVYAAAAEAKANQQAASRKRQMVATEVNKKIRSDASDEDLEEVALFF